MPLFFDINLYVSVVAIAGLSISFYIWKEKQHDARNLVCPLKGDCAAVVTSKYGYIWGIPNELLGMLYYAFMAVSFALFFFWKVHDIPEVIFIGYKLAALGSFFFSLYLMGLQIFIIKKFCTWCIASALCATAIAALVFYINYFIN